VSNKERIAAVLDRLEAERDALLAEHKVCLESEYALAARVQEMREAGYGVRRFVMHYAASASTSRLAERFRVALATPDHTAQILARRDAAIWMEAAEVCYLKRYAADCSYALRAKSAELLKGLEEEQ